MRNNALVTLLVLGLATSACMASGTQLTQEKAAFDFNCAKDTITVTQLSGMSERGSGAVFGARGCGKRASYVRTPESGVILNSPIQEDK